VLLAHIAGVPVEETLMAAPPLTVVLGLAVAELRSRRARRVAERRRQAPPGAS
jgi:hypothetical protein